jgi:hypothetical protein
MFQNYWMQTRSCFIKKFENRLKTDRNLIFDFIKSETSFYQFYKFSDRFGLGDADSTGPMWYCMFTS